MAKDFLNFLKENERKSIPIKYFEEYAYLIEEKYIPRLDYLKIIDENLFFDKYFCGFLFK